MKKLYQINEVMIYYKRYYIKKDYKEYTLQCIKKDYKEYALRCIQKWLKYKHPMRSINQLRRIVQNTNNWISIFNEDSNYNMKLSDRKLYAYEYHFNNLPSTLNYSKLYNSII